LPGSTSPDLPLTAGRFPQVVAQVGVAAGPAQQRAARPPGRLPRGAGLLAAGRAGREPRRGRRPRGRLQGPTRTRSGRGTPPCSRWHSRGAAPGRAGRPQPGALHPASGRLVVRGKRDKQRELFTDNGAARALDAWLMVCGSIPGPLFCRVRKRADHPGPADHPRPSTGCSSTGPGRPGWPGSPRRRPPDRHRQPPFCETARSPRCGSNGTS
jgi:hypothetical protein